MICKRRTRNNSEFSKFLFYVKKFRITTKEISTNKKLL